MREERKSEIINNVGSENFVSCVSVIARHLGLPTFRQMVRRFETVLTSVGQASASEANDIVMNLTVRDIISMKKEA